MNYYTYTLRKLVLATLLGMLIIGGVTTACTGRDQPGDPAGQTVQSPQAVAISPASPTPTNTPTRTPTVPASPTPTPTPTMTLSPTATPSPTVTPSPTLDLRQCNALGCAIDEPVPTLAYESRALIRETVPQRRDCAECPQNKVLSNSQLDQLLTADAETLAEFRRIARSQQPYEIAPGLVYVMVDNVHHVVVDLQESGFTLRNIIPPIPDLETQEIIRITPSYCMRPETLVVTDADYHGLVGSNKTEEGRELFFHLGRAALFQRPNSLGEARYNIDVMTDYDDFARATVSWGGGPLFIFNGRYDFNPKEEWFDEQRLERYQKTDLPKMTVAISRDRKYLFLSASNGLSLEDHAQRIIELGEQWGVVISRAMRFDGNESTYMAIRMGDHLVPVLQLQEPLIVNCLAIEETE